MQCSDENHWLPQSEDVGCVLLALCDAACTQRPEDVPQIWASLRLVARNRLWNAFGEEGANDQAKFVDALRCAIEDVPSDKVTPEIATHIADAVRLLQEAHERAITRNDYADFEVQSSQLGLATLPDIDIASIYREEYRKFGGVEEVTKLP